MLSYKCNRVSGLECSEKRRYIIPKTFLALEQAVSMCGDHDKSEVITLIIQTIQLFVRPPFSGKMLNFCIPSIQTPTFEIIIPISKHLPRGARTGFAERLLAFDSLCGARARVTKRLLDYYCHCRVRTGVVKREPALNSTVSAELERALPNVYYLRRSLQSWDGGRQMCNSFPQSLQRSNGG